MNSNELTIWEHLEELRWRLIKSLVAVFICAIPGFVYWQKILEFITVYPGMVSSQFKIIYTAPTDPVIISLKIAGFTGLVLAFPFLFFQFWQFVAPGLYKKERFRVLSLSLLSTLLFLTGLLFSYFVFPMVINFLSGYGSGKMEAFYRVQEYLFFLMKLSIAFGVVFELPLLAYIFTKMGLLTSQMMITYFKYSVVAIFTLAALLTPPDIVSQLVMALPLLVLYGISIIISKIATPR